VERRRQRQMCIRDRDDTERVAYEYTTAVSLTTASRAQLISDIINSKYSVGAEFAAINNAVDNPEEYATYQAFRAQAKQLADGWISK
jgi:hypothetical protein